MSTRTAALFQALATLSLLACEAPRAAQSTSVPPRASPSVGAVVPIVSASVAPPEPALPAGMLAVIPSKTGVVRVQETETFRLLTIDDVVHAAHFKASADAALEPFDPLVSLLVRARNEARGKALVLGLGSGATAATLASTGYNVEVAEIDPAVIDVARRFFDYQGHAEAIDGLEALRREGPRYDLILMDAFAGQDVPAALANAEAAALVRRRMAPEGLFAVRLLGSPQEPTVLAALRAFSEAFPHKRLYGTGVADEPQNLYLLLSDRPFRLFDAHIGPVFPLPWPDVAAPAVEVAKETARRGVVLGQQPRRISVMGYLVRGEDGSLCIDLPHWEMGARRYVLRGSLAEPLQKRLPAKLTFPTQGDLSTDGDVTKTLHSLLGGGGVKLSTVRFSPVAVAVEGKLLPPKEVAPDKQAPPRSPPPGGPILDPFHPGAYMRRMKGIMENVQGDIEVERVHFTLDFPQWQDFRQKMLRPLATRGAKALGEGKFEEGRGAIEGLLAALDKRFGRFAPRLVTYDELAVLRDILRVEGLARNGSGANRAGVTCDRARYHYKMEYGGPFWSADGGTERRELGGLLAGLYECAIRDYENAAGKKPTTEEARVNAARLVALLGEPGWDEWNEKKRDAFEKRADKLRDEWGVEGKDEPL